MTTSLDKVCKPKQNIELDADKTEVIFVVLQSWCLSQHTGLESNNKLM